MRKSRPYRTYLVRCWQEGESTLDGRPLWRFSVEEILQERHRRGFNSLEALMTFFRDELTDRADETTDET